jgi:hypothetical protein
MQRGNRAEMVAHKQRLNSYFESGVMEICAVKTENVSPEGPILVQNGVRCKLTFSKILTSWTYTIVHVKVIGVTGLQTDIALLGRKLP